MCGGIILTVDVKHQSLKYLNSTFVQEVCMFKIVVWLVFFVLGVFYLYSTLKKIFIDKKLSDRKTMLKIAGTLLYVATPILFFTLAYFYGMAVFIPVLFVWKPTLLLFGLACLHGLVAMVLNLTNYDIYSDTEISFGKAEAIFSSVEKRSYAILGIVFGSLFSAFSLVFVSLFYYLLAAQALLIFIAGLVPLNLTAIVSMVPGWLTLGVGAYLAPVVVLSFLFLNLYSAISSFAEKGLKNVTMSLVIRIILTWLNAWFVLLCIAQIGSVAAVILIFIFTVLTFIPKLKVILN